MTTPATYFDGQTSGGRDVIVRVADGLVHLEFPEASTAFPLAAVRLESRLGDLPRRLDLPNGASCQMPADFELPVVPDAPERIERWVNAAEIRWSVVITTAVVLVASLWAGVVWGVPAAANVVARRISPGVERQMGAQALATLDRVALQPSKLPSERQRVLAARFDALVGLAAPGVPYALLFRTSPEIGPNAFALPGGTVVLLDELVAEAKDDDEIVAVLAHEIGHLVERHTLRQVLQTSTAGLLVSVVVGDLLSVASYAGALPAMLLNSSYSRAFEYEADRVGLSLLDRAGVDRGHLGRFLARLEAKYGGLPDGLGWLSSHPRAEDRARESER